MSQIEEAHPFGWVSLAEKGGCLSKPGVLFNGQQTHVCDFYLSLD